MNISGYFRDQELKEQGVQFGKNVLISKKTSIYGNNIVVGDNVRIDDFCILVGNIKIGSFVHIASFCQLSGSSGIEVEDFAGIASRSLLFSQSDDFSGEYMTGPLIDNKFTNVKKGKILVKKHSIIGAGCVVLPCVTLGEGTAVGALSLIHKNTEAWSIYFGTPAKKIKDRKQNIIQLEPEFLKSVSQ